MKEQNPFRVHSMRSFNPPRRLTSFANVGLSEAQLVPSCNAIQRILGYCIAFFCASF